MFFFSPWVDENKIQFEMKKLKGKKSFKRFPENSVVSLGRWLFLDPKKNGRRLLFKKMFSRSVFVIMK